MRRTRLSLQFSFLSAAVTLKKEIGKYVGNVL